MLLAALCYWRRNVTGYVMLLTVMLLAM